MGGRESEREKLLRKCLILLQSKRKYWSHLWCVYKYMSAAECASIAAAGFGAKVLYCTTTANAVA